MRFPEKLARAMEVKGVSQSWLARQTGIAQPKISAMSSGKQRPYMDQAFALARALDVPLDYLADDSQDELPAPDPERAFVLKLVSDLGTAEAKRRLLAAPLAAGVSGETHHASGPGVGLDALQRLAEAGPPAATREGTAPAIKPDPSPKRKAR